MRVILIGLLCSIASILAGGCAQSHLGLRKQDLRKTHVEARASALSAPTLSRDSQEFLKLRALTQSSPEQVFATLMEQQTGGQQNAPTARDWADLGERCYQQAALEPAGTEPSVRYYLSAAVLSYVAVFGEGTGWSLAPYDPRFRRSADCYAMSLAALVDWMWEHRLQAREGLRARWVGGEVVLVGTPGSVPWNPENAVNALAADAHPPIGFDLHSRSPGIGAPLVLQWPGEQVTGHVVPRVAPIRPATLLMIPDATSPASFARPGPLRCEVRLVDPLTEPTITIAGRQIPVESDLGLPLALLLEKAQQVSGTEGLLDVDSVAPRTGLYTMGPYRPGVVPIVLVHGLMSRPLTWLPMISDLLSDPRIARDTQLWFFLYPTGNPILESAALLRESLAGVRAQFDPDGLDPAMNNMLIIGHSMGGVLSRLMVQGGGDELWGKISAKSIDDLNLEAADEAELRRLFYFKPVPGITRALFMAAPHRGADLADTGLARFGSSLIRLPAKLSGTMRRTLTAEGKGSPLERLLPGGHAPTGIDSLETTNPVLDASADMPIAIPFHTLAGRKSPGATSDGLVPLTSAHLDGAASELIIESDHYVHTRPLGIAEAHRIMLLHLNFARK